MLDQNSTVLQNWLIEASKITVEPLKIKIGIKYIKIVRDTCVYGFIDKSTGDVLFPANANTPTKHSPVRANIFKGVEGVEKFSLVYRR